MTFRSRLVLAATVAVSIAVILAALAAFLVARNALLASVDTSLESSAKQALSRGIIDSDDVYSNYGNIAAIWLPGGDPAASILPVTPQVRAVATGQAAPFVTSVKAHGTDYRVFVTPVPAGLQVLTAPPTGLVQLPQNGVLQLATPLTGVNAELGRLRLLLGSVALAGVVLAVILGWLVARTALVPLNDLTGSVEGIADTIDVSERLDPGGSDELGRLRRAFNRLLTAVESSREAQRQLVLDASHELRTPLTSLRTNLEVVRRIEDLPAEDREVLVGDVLTQMEELTHLVGDLAELSRGTPREVSPVVFELDRLVEDAVTVAASHGRARGVQFSLSIEPTWVRARADRVGRAVGNLLDNALKWSPNGATVEVQCADGEVVVRDHGPGIRDEDLPHIFDRFYRAPAARAQPGSGLGLSIVAQVADDEGGWISVEQAEGGGALFRFRLPPVDPPPPLPTIPPRLPDVGALGVNGTPPAPPASPPGAPATDTTPVPDLPEAVLSASEAPGLAPTSAAGSVPPGPGSDGAPTDRSPGSGPSPSPSRNL